MTGAEGHQNGVGQSGLICRVVKRNSQVIEVLCESIQTYSISAMSESFLDMQSPSSLAQGV